MAPKKDAKGGKSPAKKAAKKEKKEKVRAGRRAASRSAGPLSGAREAFPCLPGPAPASRRPPHARGTAPCRWGGPAACLPLAPHRPYSLAGAPGLAVVPTGTSMRRLCDQGPPALAGQPPGPCPPARRRLPAWRLFEPCLNAQALLGTRFLAPPRPLAHSFESASRPNWALLTPSTPAWPPASVDLPPLLPADRPTARLPTPPPAGPQRPQAPPQRLHVLCR